jgi:hypothetical protein
MAINLSTLVNQTNPLQLCKAWVNFNGTLAGTITPRSSYNVSSVTKLSTGSYQVNYLSNLADANYSAVASMLNSTSTAGGYFQSSVQTYNPLTTSVTIYTGWDGTFGNNPQAIDATICSVQIFGN